MFCDFEAGTDFFQNEVTLSKTFTALGARNIHSIIVVASSGARPYFDETRTRGIELLGKTVFPLGHSAFANSNRHKMHPRKVNIKIQNLTFICSDDEARKLFSFPPENQNIDEIDRRKENVEGVDFYTGEAQVKLGVRNEKQMKNLTRRSYDKRTKNTPTLWNGIPASFTLRRSISAKSARNKLGNCRATRKTGASWRGEKCCKW